MSCYVEGDRHCGRVATGVGGDAGQFGFFRGRSLQDAPASPKEPSLFQQGLWSKEGRGFCLEDVGGKTHLRAHEEAAVAVIPRFTGGQQ